MKNNKKYLFPSRTQRRNINSKIVNHTDIAIYMLFCPNYPNDWNRFVYENWLIGSELPHNLSLFKAKLDEDLFYILSKQKEFWLDTDLSKITVKPLVCEIESDLPNVIDKFANWSLDFFTDQVTKTTSKLQDYFQLKYPDINIESSLFHTWLPNLWDNQKYFWIEIQNGEYPTDFLDRCSFIARERTYMFEQLYWITKADQRIQIAQRQMANYLAVTKSIAQANPWSLVINSPTPNLYYVENKRTPEVIWEEEFNLPIFQII